MQLKVLIKLLPLWYHMHVFTLISDKNEENVTPTQNMLSESFTSSSE